MSRPRKMWSPSEDEDSGLQFLRGLGARGLNGVKLVTSDGHEGLKQATRAVLQGAIWQRCRVHFVAPLCAGAQNDGVHGGRHRTNRVPR